jgi:hypothetical protein
VPAADRQMCEEVLNAVEDVEAIEWHREIYLKRIVLRHVVHKLCRSQGAEESIVLTDPSDNAAIMLQAPVYISPHYRLVRMSGPARSLHANATQSLARSPTVDRIRLTLRNLESQMVSRREANVYTELIKVICTELGLESCSERQSADSPAVIILTPGIFANSELVDELKQLLSEKPRRELLPFFSTAVPFGFYVNSCPEELKELGLLKIFFTKWPAAPSLQVAAAKNVLSPLSKVSWQSTQRSQRSGSSIMSRWSRGNSAGSRRSLGPLFGWRQGRDSLIADSKRQKANARDSFAAPSERSMRSVRFASDAADAPPNRRLSGHLPRSGKASQRLSSAKQPAPEQDANEWHDATAVRLTRAPSDVAQM